MFKNPNTKPRKFSRLYCYKGHYIWQNWYNDGRFTISKEMNRSFETLEAAQEYIDEKFFKN